MKRRQRRIKVGPVEVGVDALKNGGIFLVGFGTAEYAANMIGEKVAQLNTTMAKAATKGVLAVITGVASVKSKTMKAEGLILSAGMAASGAKDIATMYLPGNIVAYLPTTTPMIDTSSARVGLIMAQRKGRGGRIMAKAV